MFGKPLLTAVGTLLVVWIAAIATSHTLGGWIHVLPIIALVAVVVRAAYRVLTLD